MGQMPPQQMGQMPPQQMGQMPPQQQIPQQTPHPAPQPSEEKDEEAYKQELDMELSAEIGELKNFALVSVSENVSRVVRKGVTIEEIPDVEQPTKGETPFKGETKSDTPQEAHPKTSEFVLLKKK